MKSYLIFILSIFMTSNLFSHTEIEKELLNQLNLYRKKKGLETMSLNSKLSNVSFYHASYLAKCSSVGHVVHYDKLPHDEEFDISDHKELDTEERAAMYPDGNLYGEIQYQSFPIASSASIVTLCKAIIDGFASSPGHNEIMMTDFEGNERFKPIVGISVIKVKSNIPGYYCYVVNIDFGVITP